MGLIKPTLGCSQYRDLNSVPNSPLADDLITVALGLVLYKSKKGRKEGNVLFNDALDNINPPHTFHEYQLLLLFKIRIILIINIVRIKVTAVQL